MFNLIFLISTILLISLASGRSLKDDVVDGKDPFTLDDILNGTFNEKQFNASWINDNTLLYRQDDGHYYLYNLYSKSSTLFINMTVWDNYEGAVLVAVSKSLKYILLGYNYVKIYRHSTTGQYTVYDLNKKVFYEIQNKSQIQIAKFAPSGDGLVYVFENNIYYLKNPSEVKNPRQLTHDGIPGVVYNGASDWVYEEEVLASGEAFWFSPNGEHLAFATLVDTLVPNFTYPIYGAPGTLKDQYPTYHTIRYPKAGQKLPVVSVNIVNVTDDKSQVIKIKKRKLSSANESILYGISWLGNNDYVMLITNRVQNELTVYRCSLSKCYSENRSNENQGWIDVNFPIYSKDTKSKLEILPLTIGIDRFDHLVLIQNDTVKHLTKGAFTVTKIIGWDEKRKLIYYSATTENEPYEEHAFTIKPDGTNIKCLTCTLKTNGSDCLTGTAALSPEKTFIVLTCNGPGPAFTVIKNVDDESKSLIWEDNSELLEKLDKKVPQAFKFLEVPINEKYHARVKMQLPPGFDEHSSKKYPVIVEVYAGPGTNKISKQFSINIKDYFVSSKGIIWMEIDGRGTAKDGKAKMYEVYRKLATVEMDDQISVTKYLQDHESYIDANSTGVWGWSYGGFSAAWITAKDDANVFKFGLSVAPVTNFLYYDAIYTERYMGLPTEDDNLSGYNNTDVTRMAEKFRGKNYFLIHGNADDNVHYQNSMLLAKALEAADIPFYQQSYPDENHSLEHVRKHLYHAIEKYWMSCIKKNTNDQENTVN